MNPIYNTGIHLYKAAARLAAIRSPKVREMLRGQEETLATLRDERLEKAPGGYDVWIHAASLGEFEQGRPMIERLRRDFPEKKILLTFFSPSGYTVRKNYDKVDTVAYLPFDTPGRVRAFLDAAMPKMAIFVKYEFWGNYLEQLHERHVPIYLISGIFRSSQRFFRPGGEWARGTLRKFTHLYVQDENSRQLLASIGLGNATVAGDTRFDRVTDIMKTVRQLPVIERFTAGSPFTLIAGSSWGPDEDMYIPWLKAHPDVRAIIAPHEFDGERLALLRKRFDGKALLLSELEGGMALPADLRILIVDSFGLLSSIYRYGTAAWIGGGFGTGIHNINEAAVYGLPVIFGPKHHKFKEAADLIAAGAAFEVRDKASAAAALTRLVDDIPAREAASLAAKEYISKNIGATDKIYAELFPHTSSHSND